MTHVGKLLHLTSLQEAPTENISVNPSPRMPQLPQLADAPKPSIIAAAIAGSLVVQLAWRMIFSSKDQPSK